MLSEDKKTVVLFDKEYEYDSLSDEVRRLVDLYQVWDAETVKLKADLFKNQCALKSLTDQIKTLINPN
jgi:hypothetical protein